MLSIYICEDNPIQLTHFQKIINNIILIEEFDMKVLAAVTGPDELLAIARRNQTKEPIGGFYLLDIDLNAEMDGFTLAQEIRSFDSRAFIVFITTHSEMTMLTFQYQIEAMDFILKDESWNISLRIRSCLEAALQRYHTAPQSSMVTFKAGSHTIHIEQNTILYITASSVSHKIQVVMKDEVREFYGSLESCSKKLNESFVRCHKATIVNIAHVKQIDRKTCTLTLSDGQTCTASTRGILHVINAICSNDSSDSRQHLMRHRS